MTVRSRSLSWRALAAVPFVLAMASLSMACSKVDASSGALRDATAQPVGTGVPALVPDPAPVSGGKLRFAVPAETTGWNPAIDNLADAGHVIASTVFEPLAVQDRDGNVEPWLAESIRPTVAGDFTAWTIRLRPNVTFHDGEALDAEALKRNLDFYRGDSALTGLALKPMYQSVTVTDPLTVAVQLTRPWAAYPTSLAVGGPAYVMAPAMITYDSDGHFNGDRTHPIGTGPFAFQEWKPNDHLSVVRNDHYWKAGHPYLDRIDFLVMTDPSERVEALQSKKVDVILTASTTGIDGLTQPGAESTSIGKANVVKDDDSEETYLQLNTIGDDAKARNPFKNIHARKALAYATDRNALTQMLGGGLKPTTSPFAPTSGRWGVSDAQAGAPSADLEKAKAEVAAYKQETGADRLSFDLIGIETVDDRAVMQDLQAQWQKAGIEAKVTTMEQAKYVTQVVLGGYQAALFRSYAYRDPDSNYSFWHSSTAHGLGVLSVNFSQYSSPEIDQALDQARASDDFALRKSLYEKVVRLRNEQVLDVWLFGTPYAIAAAPTVHGLQPFADRGFANIDPKPWVTDLWKTE